MPRRYQGPSYLLRKAALFQSSSPEEDPQMARIPPDIEQMPQTGQGQYQQGPMARPGMAGPSGVSDQQQPPQQGLSLNQPPSQDPGTNVAPGGVNAGGGLNLPSSEDASKRRDEAWKSADEAKKGGFNWGHVLAAIGAGSEAISAGIQHRPSQHMQMLKLYSELPMEQQKLKMQEEERHTQNMLKAVDLMQHRNKLPANYDKTQYDQIYGPAMENLIGKEAAGRLMKLHDSKDPATQVATQELLSSHVGGDPYLTNKLKSYLATLDSDSPSQAKGIETFVKDNKEAIHGAVAARVLPKLMRLKAAAIAQNPALEKEFADGTHKENDLLQGIETHTDEHNQPVLNQAELAFVRGDSKLRERVLSSVGIKTNEMAADEKKETTKRAADLAAASEDKYGPFVPGGGKYADASLADKITAQKAQAALAPQQKLNVQIGGAASLAEERARGTAAGQPTMDKPTLERMAAQAILGDTKVYAQIPYRDIKGRQDLQTEITRQMQVKGLSPEEMVAAQTRLLGEQAASRAVGTRGANLGLATEELFPMLDTLVAASEKVNRTTFVPINKALLAGKMLTSDPDAIQLSVAANTAIQIYARAVQPVGVPTDAIREHARELLEKATDHQGVVAATNMLRIEAKNANSAVPAEREKIRKSIMGDKYTPSSDAKPGAKGELPSVKTNADFDKLPPGTDYLGGDGRRYHKK